MSDTLQTRRRIDRVLSLDFVADLPSLSDDELRSRRAEAQAEEQDVSYVRRLLQGRLDLLRREQERRTGPGNGHVVTGHSDAELVEALSRVLVDSPRGGGPADVRHVDTAAPTEVERRRLAESAVADIRISDPTAMDDDELAAVIERLEALEADLSMTRRRLFSVLEDLHLEVERRVEAGRLPADAADTPSS